MKQLATVLNFPQAAALLGHKHKQPEPQTFKMTRCHDGVFRVLVEAPKFWSGGFTGTWTGQAEYIINPNRNGK
jgi:hypothetical protein